MSNWRVTTLVLAVSAAAFGGACSEQTPPTAPSPSSQPVPGWYHLLFFREGETGLEPVTTLPVNDGGLILGAHVVPAQGGAVVFQYCSYKGLPPNDIERADEAPSEACESGLATWTNLRAAIPVNATGDAFFDFGVVHIPRTVGFRFRYLGQGSGLANGVSAPADFTWVPES